MVHPSVLAAYREASCEYWESANDTNETGFFTMAKQAKKPIKHLITQVYRLRRGKKEYVFYHETLHSFNAKGGKIDHSRTIGKYQKPTFTKIIVGDAGESRSEIESHTEVYELEFPKDWTKELDEQLTDDAGFVLITAQRKYSGFSRDDFFKRSFEELEQIGRYGTLHRDLQEEVRKQKAERIRK